jgi:hypothetical protein
MWMHIEEFTVLASIVMTCISISLSPYGSPYCCWFAEEEEEDRSCRMSLNGKGKARQCGKLSGKQATT